MTVTLKNKLNDMESDSLICLKCKHWREFAPGCDAFPDGIPDEILLGESDHKTPLEGQQNDIVFEPKAKSDE